MKLVAMDLIGVDPVDLYKKRRNLLEKLKASPEYVENRFKYFLKELDEEKGIIIGTIYQAYYSNSALIRNESGDFEQGEVWDTTVFAIDCRTANLYLEKKKYIGVNLNHNKTVARAHSFITKAVLEVFNGTVTLLPLIMGVDKEFITENLQAGRVKSLKISDLYGKMVPTGTKLHNPREQWDQVWSESYNEYDSQELDVISIVAKKDHTLKRSVIAKAALAAGGTPTEAKVYDDAEEKYVTMREVTEAAVTVTVPASTDSIQKGTHVKNKLIDSPNVNEKFRPGVVKNEKKQKSKRNRKTKK